MKCARCGTEINDGDKFCLGCGFEVGKEYVPEVNETLDNLMEMPASEEHDDIEEMDIDGVKQVVEFIDGNVVCTSDSIVGENVGNVKVKKKFNLLFILIPILIIIGLVIYFNFDNIRCLFINCKPNNNIKIDEKVDVINHPTEVYVFDNRFIFRLNDLWIKNNDEYVNGNAIMRFNKYVFDVNSIDYYLGYIGVTEKEERVINDINYYYLINGNNKEYVIVLKEKIYVISFENVNDEDINNILNNVIFYK